MSAQPMLPSPSQQCHEDQPSVHTGPTSSTALFSSQKSVQSSSRRVCSPTQFARNCMSASFTSAAEVRLQALAGMKLPTSSESLATAFTSNSSMMRPICRICHGGADLAPLITPCRCAGTMQFVHRQCLTKWLEVCRRRTRKSPRCELCKYQYQRHKKFKLHNLRSPRVSRQDQILHIVFVVNLFIMIGCAVATIMCFLSDKRQISRYQRDRDHLSVEEVVTLTCGVLFFVSFFVAMAVQIKARHTLYQVIVRFLRHNMEWQIYEYDPKNDSSAKHNLLSVVPEASTGSTVVEAVAGSPQAEQPPEFV